MNKILMDAKNLYISELAKLTDKRDLSQSNIEWHYKLIDMIKDICKIECMDEETYEDEYSGRRSYRMSNSRYYPYMGEYSVEGTYGRGYSGNYDNRYSRNSSMQAKLQKLMDEAENDHDRNMVRAWMNELNS